MSKIELIITTRERDIGGLYVRRVLPYATHRLVGPFIFFDHMGPASFPPGQGLDVRPHPHLHLSTVTYLFSGKIRHRDSLGYDQLIEAGAINWMTAGKGIVHSERTPDELREQGSHLHGIQCWVALPEEFEETPPSFTHHPSNTLPQWQEGDVTLKVLLGNFMQHSSPVPLHSDLFYAEGRLPRGATLTLPADERETALYLVSGDLQIEGAAVAALSMAIVRREKSLTLVAAQDSHVMILGGRPLGQRYIDWNFVSSSQEKIEEAREEWRQFPHLSGGRFTPIPGDDREFIPLPSSPDQARTARGTIM